ncbi:MAG: class I SAM-dependent methyltransferase, partial [Candidatus Omnitrophica bacterium]|nr:class I SAM-dependent methyltransferase [Candidatus Omnitrophota bacterium]
MRNIVIFDEYNEIDLKPSELFNTYLKLIEKDVFSFLVNEEILTPCLCPGCQSRGQKEAFVKLGLTYLECESCKTVYLSPRPSEAALIDYYRNSQARIFWREELSKVTASKRKEKIIKPRFDWINGATAEYFPQAKKLVDINTAHYNYIEEILGAEQFEQKILINPFLDLDSLKLSSEIKVINSKIADLYLCNEADVVCLFEVIDRASDVDLLLDKVYKMLRSGGLCFITTVLISGFDLQILWDKAENLCPPDRMNLFTVEGLKVLFERRGFECIEFSTPGVLDLAIVAKTAQQNKSVKLPRFVKYIVENRDENVKRSFQ